MLAAVQGLNLYGLRDGHVKHLSRASLQQNLSGGWRISASRLRLDTVDRKLVKGGNTVYFQRQPMIRGRFDLGLPQMSCLGTLALRQGFHDVNQIVVYWRSHQ